MAKIDTTAVINAVRLAQQSGDPSAPASGYWLAYVKSGGFYIQDTSGNVYHLDKNPMTTLDDIIVAAASGVPGRLAKGSDGQVLTIDPSTHHVAWDTPAFVNPMTTLDDIMVGGASGAPARLAKGSDSQVLTVDPSTHHLVWATPGAGLADPLTTKGDLIVHSTVTTRLGVGSDGQVLTADAASTPGVKWAAAAGGYSDPLTTKGDLVVYGSSTTRQAVGSNGQVLTADSAQTTGVKWATPSTAVGGVVVARKTADETVNNSSTLQNDDHLTFAIGASEVWAFEGALHLTTASSGTPDFKMDFAIPSGASGRYTAIGPNTATTDTLVTSVDASHQDIGATLAFGITSGGQAGVLYGGVVVNGANAGSVTLKWAQNTATAEDTKVRTNSYIKATRIA